MFHSECYCDRRNGRGAAVCDVGRPGAGLAARRRGGTLETNVGGARRRQLSTRPDAARTSLPVPGRAGGHTE